MPRVLIGNTAPVEAHKVDDQLDNIEKVTLDIGNSITVFEVPPGEPKSATLRTITTAFNTHHSNAAPAWIESSDAGLAQDLADEFAALTGEEVLVGRPDDFVLDPSVTNPFPTGIGSRNEPRADADELPGADNPDAADPQGQGWVSDGNSHDKEHLPDPPNRPVDPFESEDDE